MVTGFTLWKFLPEADRDFLIKLFIIGLALRIIIFATFYIFSISFGGYGEITPDSRLYFLKSLGIMRSWIDQSYLSNWYDDRMNREGHLYLPALFYLFLGYRPLEQNPVSIFSDKLFNCLIGTLSAITIFYLSKGIFGKRVAKISSVFVVFFPSLVLWSMTNNRDIINIFLVSLILLSAIRLQKNKKFYYFLFLLVPLLLLISIRPYIFYSTVITIVVTFLILFWINSKNKFRTLLVFIAIVIIFLNFTSSGQQVKNKASPQAIMQRVYETNQAILSQKGTMYRIYDDAIFSGNTSVFVKFIWALSKGWFYFMLVPFPWSISSIFQLFSYLQMIIWYLLLPFVFVGIAFAVRYKLKDSLVILIYLFIVTSAFALIEGNMGSALRHRDLVSPFYFIFASVGLIKFFKGSIAFEEN